MRTFYSNVSCISLLVSLDLTAEVSTGLLVLKDQESAPQTTLTLTLSDYSTKSSPTTRDDSDKRWIMAGSTFSGLNAKHWQGLPWPVQRDFGGVMVISQGLGGDLSMWLPDIMELEFNPVVQMGASYPETPVQNAEPFRS